MQKPFRTQPALFVSAAELDHPVLRALDDAESLPDWSRIERLLSSIYASRTGRRRFCRRSRGVAQGLAIARLGRVAVRACRRLDPGAHYRIRLQSRHCLARMLMNGDGDSVLGDQKTADGGFSA